MSIQVRYILEAWQQDDILPSDVSLPSDVFVLEFRVITHSYEGGVDRLMKKMFMAERGCILYENIVQLGIVELLSRVGMTVSMNSSIVKEIYSGMVALASEAHNTRPKILPIIFEIQLYWVDGDDDPMKGAVPASETSIHELEKVALKDVDSVDKCMICLEELSMGLELEIIRMPCSHVYHQNCIVEWLRRSNLCPLCKFKMPVASP